MDRFKAEAGATEDDKSKIADRKARFGAEGGERKGPLEFTLDEYKIKK